MSSLRTCLTLPIALIGALFSLPCSAEDAAAAAHLKVMSFNLRYATANDGDDRWELRRNLLLDTIKNFAPDLLGTQETLPQQVEFLQQMLPQYDYFGRSRESDAAGGGEQCAVFFRRDRFVRLSEGHFWLSENPTEAGSKSWDSSLPRMVTWLTLQDKTTSRTFQFLNTHFDHQGSKARLESARLLRSHVDKLPAGEAVVITGDFNCGADSEPYLALFTPGANPLHDTFRTLHADETNSGTFHAFRGVAGARRIDWIASTSQLRVVAATIDRTARDGRYPSDHFPVTATLRWE